MDPHKQKQLVNQLFENTAKSEEELNKMNPEERKEYLRGRLRQRLFFNGASRQSMQQKKKLQEKMEDSTSNIRESEEEATANPGEKMIVGSKKSEKNRKNKLKKKLAKEAAEKAVEQSELNEVDDDIVFVKRDSESEYESDEN